LKVKKVSAVCAYYVNGWLLIMSALQCRYLCLLWRVSEFCVPRRRSIRPSSAQYAHRAKHV